MAVNSIPPALSLLAILQNPCRFCLIANLKQRNGHFLTSGPGLLLKTNRQAAQCILSWPAPKPAQKPQQTSLFQTCGDRDVRNVRKGLRTRAGRASVWTIEEGGHDGRSGRRLRRKSRREVEVGVREMQKTHRLQPYVLSDREFKPVSTETCRGPLLARGHASFLQK